MIQDNHQFSLKYNFQMYIHFLQISHLVIDEAHCIISWGQSKFRPAFLQLGLLRAILNKAKILALTATATRKAEAEIISCLLMQGTNIIRESPDRFSIIFVI